MARSTADVDAGGRSVAEAWASMVMQLVDTATAHPDAVLAFAYDWRLPVAHNAACLVATSRLRLSRLMPHPTAWRCL